VDGSGDRLPIMSRGRAQVTLKLCANLPRRDPVRGYLEPNARAFSAAFQPWFNARVCHNRPKLTGHKTEAVYRRYAIVDCKRCCQKRSTN
jgi:hypothetical protein